MLGFSIELVLIGYLQQERGTKYKKNVYNSTILCFDSSNFLASSQISAFISNCGYMVYRNESLYSKPT